jgi:AcrR family transcriptional regulator
VTSARTNRGPAAAAENRAALIRAAAEVFSEQGFDAPLSAIAKRAGVGQGVLYRHFRTRGELAFAAFERNLDELDRVVTDGGTLADVLREVSAQVVEVAALIEFAVSLGTEPHFAEFERRMRGIVDVTLPEGRAAGTVPPVFTAEDVLLAILMLAGAANGAPRAQREAVLARALHLLGVRLD